MIMNRFLFLFLSCLISISIYSQNDHIKFMGIPLNGSIDQFQNKLLSKGIKYDAKASKILESATRAYTGYFSGYKSRIMVYYDEKTKIVYRAKAIIENYDKDSRNNAYEDLKKKLVLKYGEIKYEGEHNNYPAIGITVYDDRYNILGSVSLFMSDPIYEYMNEYYLHVDYEDLINSNKHENNTMDDL